VAILVSRVIPDFSGVIQEQVGGRCMDLVVVPRGHRWDFASGGPLVLFLEGTGTEWLLLSLCFCVWVLGFCRRLSLAFAHLGTYSLRNSPESRPNLRSRAARRASAPGPVLHEGPALYNASHGDGAPGVHGPRGHLHVGRSQRSFGAGSANGPGRPSSRARAGPRPADSLG